MRSVPGGILILLLGFITFGLGSRSIAAPLDSNPNTIPPWMRRGVPLSAAYERMLRDQIAAGRHLRPEIVRRFGLDLPEPDIAPSDASADRLRTPTPAALAGPGGVALLPDVRLNDKSADVSCANCGNRPLGQAETAIALLGNLAVAGWNNSKGFCTGGAVQGYATSADGGATWVDHGDPPALPGGGRYRGDPLQSVNKKTGDFYIGGLYEGGALGSGIALLRGHFASGTFTIDHNQEIAVGDSNFLDKPWMAADSLSGNLYVTYSNFINGDSSRIEFIRSRDNGVTWDPPIFINRPETNNRVQGSRPAVGPDGEVHVVWYEQGFPQSHMRIRTSTDFGASFGPERTACDFYENPFSGAPGFRRPFGIALPGIAVDASRGPHRGRVYVTWDEAVNFSDAPFASASATSEVESNDFFARATPFTVGDVVRGTMNTPTDVDLYRFTASRGQTLFFKSDSAAASTAIAVRLVCSADTSSLNALRFLAFNQGRFPALVFTLPADGTYYLRVGSPGGTTPFPYVIQTTFDTPSPGERARDHRDRFIAHSNDGAVWSTPLRLNDDDPWFDGVYPEVTVDGTGAVHCFWHDFRDDPVCGAESFEYMTSSGDGGTTFGPNRRVSDARSFWSINACGSANQGDYQGITSDGAMVLPCWVDSRLGDPDVYAETPEFETAASCPYSQPAPGGTKRMLSFVLKNRGNVGGQFSWQLEDDAGWLQSSSPASSGSVSLDPGGSQTVEATYHLPETCSPGSDAIRFIASDLLIPGRRDTCRLTLTCSQSTGVSAAPAVLSLAPPRPNPSTAGMVLGFSLSRPGAARLEIYSAAGTRIRTLTGTTLAAGAHAVRWDGLDGRGRRAPAGIYFVRLVAEENRLERPFAVLH